MVWTLNSEGPFWCWFIYIWKSNYNFLRSRFITWFILLVSDGQVLHMFDIWTAVSLEDDDRHQSIEQHEAWSWQRTSWRCGRTLFGSAGWWGPCSTVPVTVLITWNAQLEVAKWWTKSWDCFFGNLDFGDWHTEYMHWKMFAGTGGHVQSATSRVAQLNIKVLQEQSGRARNRTISCHKVPWIKDDKRW